MLNKRGDLRFPLSAEAYAPVNANIQFSTQDTNSAELRFSFFQNGVAMDSQTGISGDIFLLTEDGSTFLDSLTIVDAPKLEAKYILTDAQLAHYGKVQAEVYLLDIYGHHVSVHKFNFTIDQALVDQDIVPVTEYYVKNFNDLKAVLQQESDGVQAKVDSLEAKFTTLDNIETKAGATQKADTALYNANLYTDDLRRVYEAHELNASNPHSVTKSQVGLANVLNVKQASETDLNAHKTDLTNPHGVTKAQVGLSNVTNDKQATETAFNAHTADTANPHGVTKGQVGLGNVTNVAQASKSEFDTHANNADIHVTAAKKSEWDAKETTQGAQAKADAAEQSAVDTVTAFAWTDATLTNSFTEQTVGQAVQYGITSIGEVYVRGVVSGGALGTAVFTLPAGARPTRAVKLVGAASDTTADICTWVIGTEGTVTPVATTKSAGETDFLALDFSFMTI